MIRPMTTKDSVHVQQIARKTWRVTYNGLIPEETQTQFIDRFYSYAMMEKCMEKTFVLIAEHQGTPIGFANFTRKDEDGDSELTAMYILPEFQQLGYGAMLFKEALSILQDAHQLFVYVDERNTIGRTFYEKHGFELLDVFEENFEGHPVVTAQYVYHIRSAVLVS